MNILILALGKLGSTARAGEILARSFSGKNKITCISKIIKEINYADYDAVIFGTNVRMGRFNKLFTKQIKKFRKSNLDVKDYYFIVGASLNGLKYEKKLSKKVGNKFISFVGGELITDNASRGERAVINSVINYYKRKSVVLPSLDTNKIKCIAQKVMLDYEAN